VLKLKKSNSGAKGLRPGWYLHSRTWLIKKHITLTEKDKIRK